jgi:PPIC-type PPIASE domain
MPLVRWLREPLVQFLLIGAVLFIVFDLRGGGERGGQRIVVTPGQVDAVAAGFRRTWNRPPNEQELKAQLDEYVREEIAVREAVALGLDRDDTVIRRRLRQKFEFAAEDAFEATPATDAELQAFLDTYPDNFRTEPRFSLRQVHLGQQRGKVLQDDARQILDRLQAAGPDVEIRSLSDSRLLPAGLEHTGLGEVARIFGDEFAAELLKAEPGRWVGPVRSGYGLHLVIVDSRDGGQLPALADVRPLVERDFMAERRKRALDAMYARLLARYPVVIERRSPTAASAAASGPMQ